MQAKELITPTLSIKKQSVLVDWGGHPETNITVLPNQKLHYFFIQGLQSEAPRLDSRGLSPDGVSWSEIPHRPALRDWCVGKESRTLRIELREHSALVLYGLTCATGEEKLRTDLVVSHKGEGATSLVNLKGIAADRSHIIINGMINIEPQAQQSNARLEERILLLSPEARAETIPNLEIQADDVRAGHAATVSKVSDNELFYLQTRGISKHAAQQLIVSSFLYAQLRALPEGALRDKIEAALSEKLKVRS